MFSHRTILSPIGLQIYMAGVTPRRDTVSVCVWDDGTARSQKDETRKSHRDAKRNPIRNQEIIILGLFSFGNLKKDLER